MKSGKFFRECNVFFYGAGNLGKKLFRCFEENGISITGFIDRHANILREELAPIFSLKDPLLNSYTSNSVVVLAGLFGRTQEEMIRKDLRERGFYDICSLRDIEWNGIEARAFLRNLFIGNFDPIQLKKPPVQRAIQEALCLFSREEQEYIRTYIEAHSIGKYGMFPEPLPMEDQYLAKGIEGRLDLRCFVDAGAFDGDVLRRFVGEGLKIGNYIAFEPQMELCRRIFETASQEPQVQKVVIFPSGLSDAWENIGFSVDADGMSAAKVDAHGKNCIPCVPLDEALLGVPPTFLKMDIEGMELKALHGAEQIIREYHPQLAICVYHELSHIWEIPLYIKSLYEGYRFHIRNYQYMGLETVVYAFP